MNELLGIGIFFIFLIIMFFVIMFIEYIGYYIKLRHKHDWSKWEDVYYNLSGTKVILKKKCLKCGLVKYKRIKI